MNCGFSSLRLLALPTTDSDNIFGTWDFKWPSRKKIRVAFQKLPENFSGDRSSALSDLIAKVKRFATTWHDHVPDAPRFEFIEDAFLPAPSPSANRGQSPVKPADPYVAYDELVSFAPLPIGVSYDVIVPPPEGGPPAALFSTRTVSRAADGSALQIVLPTAQLGRFALRCDYGVPTIYLGQPKRDAQTSSGVLEEIARVPAGVIGPRLPTLPLPTLQETANDYFGLRVALSQTREFEAAIVHEFGHVLGIPHLHQSPRLFPRWKDDQDLIRIFQTGMGVSLNSDFVKTQITLPFPSSGSGGWPDRAGIMFADWPEPAVGKTVDSDRNPLDSAMTHPLQSALLVPARVPLFNRYLAPQPPDLEYLAVMYGYPGARG
ncbi:MAG: hypothetical protein ABSC94_23480 [Polyangiaceae bacterium]